MWYAVRTPASAFCLAALLAIPGAASARYHGPDAVSPTLQARLHPDGAVTLGGLRHAERKPLAGTADPHLTTPPGCAEPLCGLRGGIHEIEAEP